MSDTTTADTPSVSDLLESTEQLAGHLKSAMEYGRSLEDTVRQKDQEIEQLKSASPAEPKVELQKVAFSNDQLDRTLDFLVERELLDPDDRVKVASQMRDDPNVGLRLMEQVAAITAQPIVEDGGTGIAKSAGTKGASAQTESEDFGSADGWLKS